MLAFAHSRRTIAGDHLIDRNQMAAGSLEPAFGQEIRLTKLAVSPQSPVQRNYFVAPYRTAQVCFLLETQYQIFSGAPTSKPW